MKIADLKANPKNPRKISKKKLDALKKSLDKFGDLSGFVFNTRSKTMVSGHQKTKTIPKDSKIVVEQRYETPTKIGTVADGYILIKGERFKYREVDWDTRTESEAMLAANKHGGEWDTDLLRVVIADVGNIEVTGFEIPELKALNIDPPQINIPATSVEETDEQYLKNEKKTTEQIDVENPNQNASTFDDTKEKKMDVVGKRFVIIIDCTSAEHKESLKELIKETVDKAGGKFF